MRYYINNEPLSIKNIINYLYCLKHHNIIPNFMLNITDTEIQITTIYSCTSTQLPLSGHTIITYNIYTKKWRGSINLASRINGNLVDKTFTNIQRDFPFVINNNLLKINYKQPYVEYIIESDYVDDIIEPSLNVFMHDIINPRDIIMTPDINRDMIYFLNYRHFGNEQNIQNFYLKIDAHEIYLQFLSKKNIISKEHFLPEYLWKTIQCFY